MKLLHLKRRFYEARLTAYEAALRAMKRSLSGFIHHLKMVEGVLILRNSFLKLKTVAGNAILLNYAVSSENISESIKIKTENGFYLKVNVGIFRRNKSHPEKQSHRRHLLLGSVPHYS